MFIFGRKKKKQEKQKINVEQINEIQEISEDIPDEEPQFREEQETESVTCFEEETAEEATEETADIPREDDELQEEAEIEQEASHKETSADEINSVPEKKSFFAKLRDGLGKTRDALNDKVDSVLKVFKKIDEELYEELEEALIMADVGVETSMYIINELRAKVKEKRLTESTQVKAEIAEIISAILSENDNSLKLDTTPSVIMVIGVNGVGKTTSIGKMAARYKSEGKNVIFGAADTFRAAAIDQLSIWADRVGADIVKHDEGSDPASVVFDTVAAAKSRKSDVIIIDTAGRLHNKKNLMDELAKINRIIERELPGASREVLLVLDATTGQNAVNQAEVFNESADITGIILTKLDGSAKGGIVLAIAHEHSIPVKLVGVGEGIDDLQSFDAKDFASAMISF